MHLMGRQMRRREFITLLGGAIVTRPLDASAQQPNRVRVIGVLMGFSESDPVAQSWLAVFRDALTKLGWTEGSNLRIELRWSAGDPDRMKTFAKELVDLRPDAIFGQTTPGTGALANETRTIPIVFGFVADPIASSFAASLAHPGGNITGFTNADTLMGGKWLELLKEIAPRTVRVALLFNPATVPLFQSFTLSVQTAAPSFAVKASAAPVHAKDEIEGVIAAQARTPGGSLIVLPDTFNSTNRELIIALAARYGLPAIYNAAYYSELGGLISYGDDRAELFRLAAGYIDRILRGARPADLPIQFPTKFQRVINLKTAKVLCLAIPQTLLATADKVIE
jgi:putative tryptophan/tyrosine transport system substrate-binding protein